MESSLPARHGVVISRKIDCAINELMDTFIQNSITPWYTSIVSDPTPSIDTLRSAVHNFLHIYTQQLSLFYVRFAFQGPLRIPEIRK